MRKILSMGILCLSLCIIYACSKQTELTPKAKEQSKVQSNKSGSINRGKTVLAPEDMRASVVTDSIEGTFDVENRKFHFVHRYNSSENKPYSVKIILLEGAPILVDTNNSNDTIAVNKTPREYFKETLRCSNLPASTFVQALNKAGCYADNLIDAYLDCFKYDNCKHCWMQERCD